MSLWRTPGDGDDDSPDILSLYFRLNSTQLRQDTEVNSRIHMASTLKMIRKHLPCESAHITLCGFASEEGDKEYNQKLSESRANTIRERLIKEGIPSHIITAIGHGETTTFPGMRWHDRRVAVRLTSTAGASAPLLPGHKHLTKGTMEWRLEPSEADADGFIKRRVQVKFTPNWSLGCKTITFLQTMLGTKRGTTKRDPSKKPKIDILPDEYEPFYGMDWDPNMKKWIPESAPKGFKNAPSSAADRAAYLFDEPIAPPTRARMFETVAVVPETGETLGALKWGVGEGAERVYCTDAPSAEFHAAVERFYATPTAIGPVSGREERYDVILNGFIANDATLTADQEKQLDPIITRVRGDPRLMVIVGGFADAMELDPIVISEQRAQAVASYLIGKGVPTVNLKVTGFGATWARYGLGTKESKEGRTAAVQLRLRY